MTSTPKLDLGALLEMSNNMENDDIEAQNEAMTGLADNVMKILNITDDQLSNMTVSLTENFNNYGGWGGWNETDLLSNDTNSTGFHSWGGHGGGKGNLQFNLSSLFNMSNFGGGGDGSDSAFDTDSLLDMLGMGKPRTHSTIFMSIAAVIMISFIYYVPRMLFIRLTRFNDERKTPGFIPLMFLSAVAVLGCVIHLLHFQSSFSSAPVVAMFTKSTVNKFNQFLFNCLAAGINRVISPLVVCVCLQQLAAYTSKSLKLFNTQAFQIVYCFVATIAVFGYSFYKQMPIYTAYKESRFKTYPDPVEVDYFELIFPFITAALFFFAKNKVSRKAVYTSEKMGPQGPTILDRVSKVVVYQVVVAAAGVALIFVRRENDTVDSWQTFFLCAQTPLVHFVLFRSLLRTRKSTRICFLLCCGGEEKVASSEQAGMELNHHPQTNEPSQKNEEEEGEEEKTEETLDHNKIVLVRESQFEKEKEEENRRIGEGEKN